jgi:hypothetical protein
MSCLPRRSRANWGAHRHNPSRPPGSRARSGRASRVAIASQQLGPKGANRRRHRDALNFVGSLNALRARGSPRWTAGSSVLRISVSPTKPQQTSTFFSLGLGSSAATRVSLIAISVALPSGSWLLLASVSCLLAPAFCLLPCRPYRDFGDADGPSSWGLIKAAATCHFPSTFRQTRRADPVKLTCSLVSPTSQESVKLENS